MDLKTSAITIFLLCTQAACAGEDEPPTSKSLIDMHAWAWQDAGADPSGHRPEEVICPDTGWYYEEVSNEPTLEVDTEECDYLSVSQPLLASFKKGDVLFLRLWHYHLIFPDTEWAHAALYIGGQLLWESQIAIPAEANFIHPEFSAPFAAEKGAPINFHLHNHGNNTWNLFELSLKDASD
ncbi:MAG: hypothetical protein QGI45_11435 [Myxococcota bacterium]|jgi:hypothetical protein|nr:hypothetical protein [Myxococcota bacterium]